MYKKNDKLLEMNLDENTLMIYDEERELNFVLNDSLLIIYNNCDKNIQEIKEELKKELNITISDEELLNDIEEALNSLVVNNIILVN